MKPENLAHCDIVISMLSDDHAVRDVACIAHRRASRLLRGAIHRGLITIGSATATFIASEPALRDQSYVAVPVFEKPADAEASRVDRSISHPEPRGIGSFAQRSAIR
jgi:3-hydroxyisobutyrate dehydrogenase-like beta-hydroxyacid dehydrogenase